MILDLTFLPEPVSYEERGKTWSKLAGMPEDGFNRVTPFSTNITTFTLLHSHTETAYTPRAGVAYGLTEQWQLTATAYAAFRAPTLNELYRSFRQGNTLTLGNEELQAEHLQGGEAGIRYMRRRVMVSGVFFRENVDDPVGNITLTSTPALITRERQNIGTLRTMGGDVDLLMNLPGIQLRAGYEYVHSIVSSFSANPTLVGNFVPQVPAHSGSVSAVYAAPRNDVAWENGRLGRNRTTQDPRITRQKAVGHAARVHAELKGGLMEDSVHQHLSWKVLEFSVLPAAPWLYSYLAFSMRLLPA